MPMYYQISPGQTDESRNSQGEYYSGALTGSGGQRLTAFGAEQANLMRRLGRGDSSTTTSFDAGLAGDRAALDAWGASKGPSASENRFETGLASSEGRLRNLLDDPNSIQQSAAYKFRVGQGEEALNRSLAAKGMAGSGNRLTELNDYAQGQASQEYGNQFNRLKDLTSMYAGNWNQDMGSLRTAHNQKGNTLANIYDTTAAAQTKARETQSNDNINMLRAVMSWR